MRVGLLDLSIIAYPIYNKVVFYFLLFFIVIALSQFTDLFSKTRYFSLNSELSVVCVKSLNAFHVKSL